MLEHRLHLSRLPDHDAAALLLLRGLMELCVYPPTSAAGATGGEGHGANHLPVSWSCTDEAVSQVPPLLVPPLNSEQDMRAAQIIARPRQ